MLFNLVLLSQLLSVVVVLVLIVIVKMVRQVLHLGSKALTKSGQAVAMVVEETMMVLKSEVATL